MERPAAKAAAGLCVEVVVEAFAVLWRPGAWGSVWGEAGLAAWEEPFGGSLEVGAGVVAVAVAEDGAGAFSGGVEGVESDES